MNAVVSNYTSLLPTLAETLDIESIRITSTQLHYSGLFSEISTSKE